MVLHTTVTSSFRLGPLTAHHVHFALLTCRDPLELISHSLMPCLTQMWSVEGWGAWDFQPACWERNRHDSGKPEVADNFFADVLVGMHCDSNWYGDSDDGDSEKTTAQTKSKPAVVGFDDSIENFW